MHKKTQLSCILKFRDLENEFHEDHWLRLTKLQFQIS